MTEQDELNVALVLSHAQDLRMQGKTERADALVQAAEEYVAILAEAKAAQSRIAYARWTGEQVDL